MGLSCYLVDWVYVSMSLILRTEERLVYSNKFFHVYDDIVRFADGKEGTWLRLWEPHAGNGVAVLPVCGDEVGLVKIYRYAISDFQWEIPRGRGIDPDPVVTAKAELNEELGGEPEELIHLGTVNPNSAHLDSHIEMFYACYHTKTESTNDINEVSAIQWVSLYDLTEMVKNNEINDSFTLSAFAAAYLRGLI